MRVPVSFDPGAALGLALVVGLYLGGVRSLAGKGRQWPLSRNLAFGGGVLLVAVATQSGLAGLEEELFSAHVAQHVLLGMAAPMLLMLGAPVTLALQATGASTSRSVRKVVHGRFVATATHPAVAGIVFGASMFALYLTPLFELSLRQRAVHVAVHIHFVVVGCGFFWGILGVDGGRGRLPHGARILVVLLLVPFHAVLGIAILTTKELLAGGWYGRLPGTSGALALADQQFGGGLLWITGDLLGLVAAGIVLAQWMRHDERQAGRDDRRLSGQTVVPT
ncbi:MAG TPA: cytochrome c oxidase assembly protein [Acidimicrobiales bacterium]|nr:cytochrome c oxidase assembly protein [Acidimicrobiales bacterium]